MLLFSFQSLAPTCDRYLTLNDCTYASVIRQHQGCILRMDFGAIGIPGGENLKQLVLHFHDHGDVD